MFKLSITTSIIFILFYCATNLGSMQEVVMREDPATIMNTKLLSSTHLRAQLPHDDAVKGNKEENLCIMRLQIYSLP
tara:strand:- start:2819 stop:3049 length:231 start_codon:yes stop_codon:yes gene_type:complete